MHQVQIEALASRRAGDEQRQRKCEHHADGRRQSREQNGAQQDRAVERVDHAPVVFEGPGPLDAAIDAARKQAVGADDGQRREEENDKPQTGREQEPEAEAGHGLDRMVFRLVDYTTGWGDGQDGG